MIALKAGRGIAVGLIGLALAASGASARDLEVFRASRHGDWMWQWNAARVQRVGPDLVFTEQNSQGGYGDAYTALRLPYFADGVVDLDVRKVIAGKYVVQVVAFARGEMVGSADLVPSTEEAGRRLLKLSDAYMPKDTDEIVFKIWVEGAEGASIALSELLYTVQVGDDSILLDEGFRDPEKWTTENVSLEVVANHATLRMGKDRNMGSMLRTGRFTIGEVDRIILSVLTVQKGRVSLQAPVFDDMGTYLASVDVLKDMAAGFYSRRLGSIAWPEHADSFEIKLWLSGGESAAALNWMLLTAAPGAAVTVAAPRVE